MGMKGTCRSANRGGPFLCALSAYSKGLPSCLPSSSRSSIFPISRAFIHHPPAYPLHTIRAKTHPNGAKVRFSLGCFGVFSGFGRPKGAKSKDIFERWCRMWGKWCRMWRLGCLPLACPLVQVCSCFLAILLVLAKLF